MLCPNCDKEITPSLQVAPRLVVVRHEDVLYEDHFNTCPLCNAEWGIEGFDFAAAAYRAYRDKHGMIQPEKILACRENLGLSLAEFSLLLQIDEEDLSRYEHGALQSVEHDDLLRRVAIKEGLKEIYIKNKNRLTELAITKIETTLTEGKIEEIQKSFKKNGEELIKLLDEFGVK
jgi:DNA-binding transcriptional regulator YiaG